MSHDQNHSASSSQSCNAACDRDGCENPMTGYDAWGQWCEEHNGLAPESPAASERDWPEGGLPHGEHPYDYGYGEGNAASVRFRVMFAKMLGDSTPTAVGAIDETVWEHWSDADEDAWLRRGRETWGIDYDTEFRVISIEVPLDSLVEAFGTPTITGEVRGAES